MKAIIEKVMHTWWLRHPLFWLAIWNYSSLGIGMTGVDYTIANMAKAYMTNIRFQPGHWIITYPLLYLFIPKLLVKRKYLLFTLAYLGMVLLVGSAYANRFDLNVAFNWKDHTGAPWFSGRNILPFFNISGIAIAIKFIKKAYTEELDAARSEEQKVMAELELLKAQIHPHFLFNTLNNLFAHTLRNSNDAPKIVLKLSDLLRFMIYDSREDLVRLEDEIELIRNYIDLEGLRYGPEMNCQFEVEGEPGTYLIRPLLIIPLIENAFKHGMSMQTGNKWIHMKMVIDAEKLTVSIVNSKQQKSMDADKTGKVGGVGLANVRKRLQLMYPGTHEFRIDENTSRHEVHMTVPLEKPAATGKGSRAKEKKQVPAIG